MKDLAAAANFLSLAIPGTICIFGAVGEAIAGPDVISGPAPAGESVIEADGGWTPEHGWGPDPSTPAGVSFNNYGVGVGVSLGVIGGGTRVVFRKNKRLAQYVDFGGKVIGFAGTASFLAGHLVDVYWTSTESGNTAMDVLTVSGGLIVEDPMDYRI